MTDNIINGITDADHVVDSSVADDDELGMADESSCSTEIGWAPIEINRKERQDER